MLIILVNWFYIGITVSIAGAFLYRSFCGLFKYQGKAAASVCIASGLMAVTVFAQYFSLLGGVGALANALVIAACLMFLYLDRSYYREAVKSLIHGVRPDEWVFGALIVLAMAYFCSDGNFMYDTGLYHAQSIRWIEEYGAVKGIANIHERLGYNSAFFSLAALYSMKGLLGGRSLHAVQGFAAVFLLIDSLLGILRRIREGRGVLSAGNLCRLGPAVYTVLNLTEIISPTTDYITVYMIMWLVIRWVDLIEQEEQEIFPYAFLCVMAVYIVSLKLSAGLLVLLVLKPAVSLVRGKRWRDILVCLAAGLIVILPYLLRNIVVSGWLIYPFASLDLFDVDWKLARGTVIGDAMDIKLWGRGIYDRNLIDMTVFEWFPVWWEGLNGGHRYFMLAVFTALVLEVIYGLWILVRPGDRDKRLRKWNFLFLEAVLAVCYLFWQVSAPIPRYGFAFIIMVSLLAVGVMFDGKPRGLKALYPAAGLVAVGFLMLKPTLMAAREDLRFFRDRLPEYAFLVMQRDYPDPSMESADLNGIRIYYPEEPGGQSWYYAFPATNFGENIQYWENRGGRIQDGFRQKYPENQE